MIREYSKQQAMEIALIENVQRADLNPIEEAIAYQQLRDEFDLTQEEIAERVSKSRVTVTNSIRLLKLDRQGFREMLIQGTVDQWSCKSSSWSGGRRTTVSGGIEDSWRTSECP